MACLSAPNAAPSGVQSPTWRTITGRIWIGTNTPAKNESGKKLSQAMQPAAAALAAMPVIHSPMPSTATAASATDRTRPPGLLGVFRPNHPESVAARRIASPATAMQALTASWAPSTQADGTGVVDNLRKMPCSLEVASAVGRLKRPIAASTRTISIAANWHRA
jgi:hypothetical protein